MTHSIVVQLPPVLASFVADRLASGAFASADDVVRAALLRFAADHEVETGQEPLADSALAVAAIERLRELRPGTTLGPDLTVRDLRDDGRR